MLGRRRQDDATDSLSSWDRSIESFVVLELDVARAMTTRGRLRLRGAGTCMDPNVRNGDVLHVEPRTADEISVGDVVAFRREGRLFAHRAIESGIVDGKAYVLTRPDRGRRGNDGPLYDEDILGVVAGIDRRGRRFSLCTEPTEFRRRGRLWGAPYWRWDGVLRIWAQGALLWMQSSRIYRFAAHCWFARRHQELCYAVHAPLHAGQRHDLYRRLTLDEFATLPMLPEVGGLDRWTLLVRIGKAIQPAAWTEIEARPTSGGHCRWTVAATRVRCRYRSTGIEQILRDKVAEMLAGHDMSLEAVSKRVLGSSH